MKHIAIALTAVLALSACGTGVELSTDVTPSPTATPASDAEVEEPTPVTDDDEPTTAPSPIDEEPPDPPEVVAARGCQPNGTRMEVDSECFEEEWPLTVDAGLLECIRGSAVVIHTSEGTFAVNGMAETWEEGEPIDPIWRDNTSGMGGPKVSMKPLVDAGLDLC